MGRKSPTDSSFVELLKSPAMITSGFSRIFLSTDPNELCDRIKLLLQEKLACFISNIIIGEVVAIFDKLEYKSMFQNKNKTSSVHEEII